MRRFWIIPFALAILVTLILWQVLSSSTFLIAWLVAINAIAFFTFWYDKSIAGTGVTRVPELVLVTLAFAGGWPLAYVAMQVFRHKTGRNSKDFRIKFWGGVILELILAAAYLAFRR
jgi:uncharacterized membrane protein YsdA (DUF1294 family)